MQKLRVLDVIWLLALGVYVVAGIPIAPFHGDETNYIWGAHDYITVFLNGQPHALVFEDPHTNGAGYLRVVQGSVVHFSIGFTLHASGMLDPALLPRRGYHWGQTYQWNVENGTRPSGEFLVIARYASGFYVALAVGVMFGLGNLLGGRPLAYIASGLFALNPVILMHGRRAMQDGPLLFFGLLAVLLAAWIVRRRETAEPVRWPMWLGLSVASALAVASKNTGVIFVVSAFLWICAGYLPGATWPSFRRLLVPLVLSGALAVILFWAISPGMWHDDPLERISQVISVRQEQMESQVAGINRGPATLEQRAAHLLLQPYLMPLLPFELRYWGTIEAIATEVARYNTSFLSGLHFGPVLGAVLMLLAVFGLAVIFLPRVRPPRSWGLVLGLFLWFAVNVVILLLNPLPWQRYYLPYIPIVILLTSLGIAGLARVVGRLISARSWPGLHRLASGAKLPRGSRPTATGYPATSPPRSSAE